jgi:hypothetical protein
VFRKRSNSGKILIAAVVGLLMVAVVAVEFPELITLTDNVTNDFTIHKTTTPWAAMKVGVASYDTTQRDTKNLRYDEPLGWVSSFDSMNSTSSSLCILLCTLRT